MAEFLAPRHEVPQPFSPKPAATPLPASAQAPSDAASAPPGRPASSTSIAAHDPAAPPAKRQVVCFSFYKLMPEWRRLSADERAAHKAAFAAVLEAWNKPGEFLSL